MRCGYIGIVGRPNVGKSTLLNAILGKKLTITSKKAQTTRHAILGIKNVKETQFIYVDTPGYRDIAPKALQRYLNRTTAHAVFDANILLWVVDSTRWTEDDDAVLQLVQRSKLPTILVLNKIDQYKNKRMLLPLIADMQLKYDFLEIVPVSALDKSHVEPLEQTIEKYLPEQAFFYDAGEVSDKPATFFYAEIIREKVMRFLGEEVPYSVAVEIEKIEETQKAQKTKSEVVVRISAILWVEREGQKAILIGDEGSVLKRIGTEARLDIETFIGKKVFLSLWVKVKERWSDDEEIIRSLGYA